MRSETLFFETKMQLYALTRTYYQDKHCMKPKKQGNNELDHLV